MKPIVTAPERNEVDVPAIENPAIDMAGYLKVAAEAAAVRETHRLTEDEFIRLSRVPGTIILDASTTPPTTIVANFGAECVRP